MESTSLRILDRPYTVYGYPGEEWFEIMRGAESINQPHQNSLRQLVRPDAMCLDVGANLGIFSLTMSQLAPEGKVYSFEPDPKTFVALTTTLRENHIANVEPLEWVVGRAGEAGIFMEEPKCRSSSHFSPYKGGDVVAHSIDSMNLDRVDVIKIDAEGSEIDVLAGAIQTIGRCRPLVMMEFNSFAFIYYRDMSPRTALNSICNFFGDVQFYDRRNAGVLTKLDDREKFLCNNLLGGFVDDLLCSV
jgi:FkbM family methyltransferase